ncbi:hypothetical protein NKI66_16930 [Mesorhizobium sp. M0518]|uniref:hypothetical protein n=1 Tax=unclassified Mesorhizobium TaxID=325217 RepID=UPI0033359484
MNKFTVILAAVAVASSVGAAEAGCGCGGSGGWGGNSGSLINVSPSIDLGKITALNDVLSGNNILSGLGVNLLGGNSYRLGKRH